MYDRQDLEKWLDLYRALPRGQKGESASLTTLWETLPSGAPAVVCCNALLNEAAKDNNLPLLAHIHDFMQRQDIAPDVITYNTYVKGYLGGQADEAMGQRESEASTEHRLTKARSLLQEMRSKGLAPNARTYTMLVSFLGSHGRVTEIEEAVADMERDGVEVDVITQNSVLQGYAKAGALDKMEQIFRHLQSTEGYKPTAVTYHTLMNSFGKLGQVAKMTEYWNALKKEAKKRPREIEVGVRAYTILLAGFGESGDKEGMMGVWNEMTRKRGIAPNAVSYGTLINSLGRMGHTDLMLHYFRAAKGDPKIRLDGIVYNHLLTHLGKSGRIEQTEKLFEEMKRDGIVQPNVVLYNVMLDCYAKAGMPEKAESAYRELLARQLRPTAVTFAALVEAETRACRWDRIESIIRQMDEAGVQPDAILFNNLIDAYGFMGKPERAEEVVEDLLPDHGLKPDANHFTSLIEAWARNGRLDKAETWLRRIAELPVDGTRTEERDKALLTFVSFCNEAGDKERIASARSFFDKSAQ